MYIQAKESQNSEGHYLVYQSLNLTNSVVYDELNC